MSKVNDDSIKEKNILKPKFSKIFLKGVAIGLVVAIILCVISTVILNRYYKLGIKKSMEQSIDNQKNIVENQSRLFVDSGNEDKNELYNDMLLRMENTQFHTAWNVFDNYSDMDEGHYVPKLANGLYEFLGKHGIIERVNGYNVISFSLSDNTSGDVIGTECEKIYISLWDQEDSDKSSYLTRTKEDETQGTYSVYSYKPSSEVLDKLIEWENDIEKEYEKTEDSFGVPEKVYYIKMSDDIYVKDHEFVPSQFVLGYYDWDGENDIEEIVDSIDVGVDKKEDESFRLISRSKNSEDLADILNTKEDRFMDYYNHNDRINSGNPDVLVKDTVLAADGHEYEIKIIGDYDIFADWGKTNVIIYFAFVYNFIISGVLVIVLVISLLVYKQVSGTGDGSSFHF